MSYGVSLVDILVKIDYKMRLYCEKTLYNLWFFHGVQIYCFRRCFGKQSEHCVNMSVWVGLFR